MSLPNPRGSPSAISCLHECIITHFFTLQGHLLEKSVISSHRSSTERHTSVCHMLCVLLPLMLCARLLLAMLQHLMQGNWWNGFAGISIPPHTHTMRFNYRHSVLLNTFGSSDVNALQQQCGGNGYTKWMRSVPGESRLTQSK